MSGNFALLKQPQSLNLIHQTELMKFKQGGFKIKDEELTRRVRTFIKNGGIIQKLPDQVSANRRLVGGKWFYMELDNWII